MCFRYKGSSKHSSACKNLEYSTNEHHYKNYLLKSSQQKHDINKELTFRAAVIKELLMSIESNLKYIQDQAVMGISVIYRT